MRSIIRNIIRNKREEIIINPSENRNAKIFESNSLIHSREFEKAIEWINRRIHALEFNDDNNLEINTLERLHDTITILGSRGSGKTTFLLNLLDYYEKRKNNTVEILDIIDPTLIEEKGHIFLTIISQIADRVNRKLSKSDCDPESPTHLRKKGWNDKLKSLAAGLPSIDGIGGTYESWQDTEFIMDKGLRSVQAAKNLESDFHLLIKEALIILDKKAFIITLDDIDIDFRKGWPVLETVRKYLTSPQIITLLSGDLRLFIKAIRKQQWKNFGKALTINEGEKLGRIKRYNDLVTEMEEQYLQKVIQPQGRIRLTTIQEKRNIFGRDSLNIYIKNSEIENRIDNYYNSILIHFGINNPYQAETYCSFLLGLPIRTQIQFLAKCEDFKNTNSSIREVNISDVFLSDLYEKQVNIDLAESNNKYLNTVILKLLLDEKVLDGAYQLQPTTTDANLNASLLSLSFLFSQRVSSDPYLIFDYFTRIGYVRNIYSKIGYKDEEKSKNDASQITPSIEGLCEHSSVFYDKAYRDILGSMTAYIRAFLNIKNESRISWGGTIPIYAPAGTAKDNEKLPIRIDNVLRNAPLYKRQIACMPVSRSQPNNKQQSFTTYSIYLLLGSIGEIIKQTNLTTENNLERTFGELSQIRSYAMPNFKYMSISEEPDNDNKNDSDGNNETTIEDVYFIRSVHKWINDYPKSYPASPHFLGKISTRLFYALQNLETTESVSELGIAMHNRIIILLNTILVEEAREVLRGTILSNDNPRDSMLIFRNNIFKCLKENGNENIKKLKLFSWFLSSPFLLLYLDNKNTTLLEIIRELNSVNFGYIIDVKNILKESIYLDLCKVKILKQSSEKNTVKRINFYFDNKTIQKTIDQLKENTISYEFFMKEDPNRIVPRLKEFFTDNINITNIGKARKLIIKTGQTW